MKKLLILIIFCLTTLVSFSQLELVSTFERVDFNGYKHKLNIFFDEKTKEAVATTWDEPIKIESQFRVEVLEFTGELVFIRSITGVAEFTGKIVESETGTRIFLSTTQYPLIMTFPK